ncbi:hypothetical protein F5X96DRAFT_657617 [Biscogniauxia mediterranea]|nr:hypothetical protein F5X96DRAFT_657617 [Biscogniauxia mediterranea]
MRFVYFPPFLLFLFFSSMLCRNNKYHDLLSVHASDRRVRRLIHPIRVRSAARRIISHLSSPLLSQRLTLHKRHTMLFLPTYVACEIPPISRRRKKDVVRYK